jgi:hypothetical protein
VCGEDPLINGDFGSQYTLGLQQETHGQVGSDWLGVCLIVTISHSFSLQVLERASAAAAAVPNYSAMGSTQSWDRKSFRSGASPKRIRSEIQCF